MGRIAELVDAQRVVRGPACTVGIALAEYSKADRAEWVEAMGIPTIQHTQISRAFKADGHNVTPEAISRHRKGECACGPRS